VRAPVRLSITNFPGPTHRGSPNDHGKQGPCLSARFLARKPWLTRGASTRVGRLRGTPGYRPGRGWRRGALGSSLARPLSVTRATMLTR
jgi:hypothetical protein